MLARRIDDVDWSAAAEELDDRGYAIVKGLLGRQECEAIVWLYDDRGRFRSGVVMERHGFGRGEYGYFGYPLPQVSALRKALCPRLAPVANEWHHRMPSLRRSWSSSRASGSRRQRVREQEAERARVPPALDHSCEVRA
jgi:hypothetical protein